MLHFMHDAVKNHHL